MAKCMLRRPKCHICKTELDQPHKPETLDCGGDCLKCMADLVKDPDCVASMSRIRHGDRVELEEYRLYINRKGAAQ